MISLSALVFDLEGSVVIDELPDSSLGDLRRRANRVATLDGGVVVNDFGHSPGDRTFEVVWTPPGKTQLAAVQRMLRLYGRILAVTLDGAFIVIPESLSVSRNDGEATLRLLVIQEA